MYTWNNSSRFSIGLPAFCAALLGLAVSESALALDLCDSHYHKPDYDSHVEDPDLSHEISSESRWRCVVTADMDVQISAFCRSIKPPSNLQRLWSYHMLQNAAAMT